MPSPPCCSSDELYAYLKHCRPDLCMLEGGKEDGEGDRDDEEFVLIEDEEEEDEDKLLQRHSGDDWEVSGLLLFGSHRIADDER